MVGIRPRTKSSVSAEKISNSVFRLTADAKGKEKVFGVFFFFSSQPLLRPNTVLGPYATARRMTKTPGIPELQLQ